MELRRLLLATAVLSLTACATDREGPVWPYPDPPRRDDGGYREPAGPPPGDEQRREPTARDEAYPRHSTVASLLTQAERQAGDGELEQAVATLERAIRIDGADPLPWLRLAQIRFEQGNLIQAENLARRSLSAAEGGPHARDAWRLIADIKRLQGDDVAAAEAMERSRRQ